MQLERMKGESAAEHHRRLVYGKMVDKTLADVDYAELSQEVYGQNYSSDTVRKMMYGSRLTLDMLSDTSPNGKDASDDSGRRLSLDDKIRELQEERKKLQTEKIEYSKMLRENARDDLIFEKLRDAIAALEPLSVGDTFVISDSVGARREGVLAFGDEHYGAEFVVRGLNGEVINEYNTSIAESRMESLLKKTIEIIAKEGIDVLHVFNMGDFSDGVLRVGQLRKLELGVVDSTVRYMEFLSVWLNELSKYVRVKFQMVHGNHSELRMLGQPNGTFKDENMGKVVAAYIKMRLADNPNFEFIENPTGLIFDNVLGYNILGIHGEVKNMSRAIRDFSFMYGVDIDYLLGGHLHHIATSADGYHKLAIRVPSIVGTDDFSMSLMKVSDPGATLFIVEDGVGKNVEYTIYL